MTTSSPFSDAPPDKNYIAHNAAYEAVGLKAVYLAYMTENFAQFLEAARRHQFAGFSVTMPFKVCLDHHQHYHQHQRHRVCLQRLLPGVTFYIDSCHAC